MPPVNVVERLGEHGVEYSICTLVTRPNEYEVMRRSFLERGFEETDCEYLFIDNSKGNVSDGYQGMNMFLRAARGRRVIICHQDVELIGEGRKELDARLNELEQRDPTWAIAGNSGGKYNGGLYDFAIRISDPHGENVAIGPFPCKVRGLDENFLVIKASANLAASGDLRGFHLYATDLAIVAGVLGYSAYVIDFHLRHHSGGKLTAADFSLDSEIGFASIRRNLMAKFARAFSPSFHTTTTTQLVIRPQIADNWQANTRLVAEIAGRKTLDLAQRVIAKVEKIRRDTQTTAP